MSTAGTQNRKVKLTRLALAVLVPVFFLYVASLSLQFTLNDPDLWWHLKTGQYILDTWSVPDVDPFAYTTPQPLNEDQKMGLQANWLGQIFYYLSYSIGGYTGIGLARALLITLPMLILAFWMWRNGAGAFVTLAVVSMPALLFSLQLFYSFERPQGLSFSLVLVVVLLLERIKGKSRVKGFDFSFVLLPAVTAIWSNIHGGFIVGNIVIVIYMASEAFMAVLRKLASKGNENARPVFYALCAAAIAASFINPNTYKLFYIYFTGMLKMFLSHVTSSLSGSDEGWVAEVVLEYKPLYYFYKELSYNWLVLYWIFTALLYALLLIKYWLRRRFDLAEFLTVSFVVIFANTYARGLMFSLSVMPFYMARTMLDMKMPGKAPAVAARAAAILMLVLTFALTIMVYQKPAASLKPSMTKSWLTPWYPTRAVEFLRANPISPPMYNYYTWGGFFIWNMYPEYKVFIDGRALDNDANSIADSILKTHPGWQKMLDAYGINFIVIPAVFRESGYNIPLALELVKEDGWKLVFIRNNSAIFVRDVPKNAWVIDRYNIDKRRVYYEIIMVENIFLRVMPNNPVYNLSKAEALFLLGHYPQARAIYEKFPSQSAQRLRQLRGMGY